MQYAYCKLKLVSMGNVDFFKETMAFFSLNVNKNEAAREHNLTIMIYIVQNHGIYIVQNHGIYNTLYCHIHIFSKNLDFFLPMFSKQRQATITAIKAIPHRSAVYPDQTALVNQ